MGIVEGWDCVVKVVGVEIKQSASNPTSGHPTQIRRESVVAYLIRLPPLRHRATFILAALTETITWDLFKISGGSRTMANAGKDLKGCHANHMI
jgi:hypothetical protein